MNDPSLPKDVSREPLTSKVNSSPTDRPLLSLRGITKSFPSVLANDNVDFDLFPGEIHALLGENGAGKTTLMNILAGLTRPDRGTIHYKDQLVEIHHPSESIRLGIGMVHQHFMLAPVLSVTENLTAGRETLKWKIWLDNRRASNDIRRLSSQYGLDVDPDALVRDLSLGVRQRVEILKALYRKADVLILDEPTAVLTPAEAERLFRIMTDLASDGKSLIFITHKLSEIMRAADRITVLRSGRVVHVTSPSQTNEDELASFMVGRKLKPTQRSRSAPGLLVLDINNLSVEDDNGLQAVRGVSIQLHAGEILGIAGVQGNGQTELVQTLTGLRTASSGTIIIKGRSIVNRSPRYIFEQGVRHIPEERHEHGMIEDFSIADNMILNTYYQRPFSHHGLLQPNEIYHQAETLMKRFDVRAPGPMMAAGRLSGGNQQKVVVARELSHPSTLLVCAQPTRGLDVGSADYIHRQISAMRDEGTAVLLISTELDEIIQLSDIISVMYKGQIVTTVQSENADRQMLGLLMAGATAAATNPVAFRVAPGP